MEDKNKPIDADLLRRMMLGDFSSDSSGFTPSKDKKATRQVSRKMEIDLHYEQLFPMGAHIAASQRLPMQLQALHDFIAECKKNNVRIAYAIVGKGAGKLKKEVSQELGRLKINHSLVADPPYFGNAYKLSL